MRGEEEEKSVLHAHNDLRGRAIRQNIQIVV